MHTRTPTGVNMAAGALLVAAGALLAGCAQPGQLGHDESGAAGPDRSSAPSAAPADPGSPGSGATGSAPGGSAPDGGGSPNGGGPDDPTGTAVSGVPGAPVAQAGSDTRGTLERPVEITTPGQAELLVRTEVLQPGQATGWIRHPGTATSAVRSGAVTVQRAGRCEPQMFGPGQAFFLGDGEPNELRNDGEEPVVLTRSELLAPGNPEREPTAPAC